MAPWAPQLNELVRPLRGTLQQTMGVSCEATWLVYNSGATDATNCVRM
jgi:hypothetical protein